MEPMVIAARIPVSARLLWFLDGTGVRSDFCWASFLLLSFYKANQIVNAASQEVIELENTTLKAGAQRVDVELENSDQVALPIPEQSRTPFGIRPAPRYTVSCVYMCDAFFAVFSGSSFSLPSRPQQ
jgi:hypothetical protein